MAKSMKQPIDKMNEIKVQKPNKIQWFLFVVIIPLIFAILVIAIVFSLTGGNVFEKAKDISTTISTQVFQNSEKTNTKTTEQYEKEIVSLEADIKDKEAEIKSLESVVDSRDQTIQQAEAEKQQLQKQLDELQNAQNTNQATGQSTTNSFNEVVKTYEAMSPKKSAPILAQMSDTDAVEILANLKADTVAKVLEQMTPADAARLTKKLKTQP